MTLRISLGAFVLCVALMLVPCCRPGETPVSQTPAPERPRVAPVKPPTPNAKAEGKAPEPSGAPHVSAPKELVQNGSFEEWKDGRPVGWMVSSAETAQAGGDAQQGVATLGLLSAGEQYTVVRQNLDAAGIVSGGTLTVSCLAKAVRPNQFVLKLTYQCGGETVRNAEVHSGRGDWARVQFKVDVPPDAKPETFSLQLLRRPNTEGQVLADVVSVLSE